MKRVAVLLSAMTLAGLNGDAISAEPDRASNSMLVFIGTYTGSKSKGIYVSRLDPQAGKLSAPELAVETRNPSFLAVHPNRQVFIRCRRTGQF